MNKTKSLRKEISTKIYNTINADLPTGEAAIPVYYGQARTDHPSRYIVFTVDEVTRLDGCIAYETEINVMDYGTSTGTAEDMADDIQKAFDKLVIINDDIAVRFDAAAKNTVQEEDRNIIRRRMTFDTYLYERG